MIGTIRDRVRELRRVPARELIPNPRNWRRHPQAQKDALKSVLSEIGYAGALLARETADGLMLIDGHLRAETTPETPVPVLVLDVTEDEANTLLATVDPLAAMAETDKGALRQLLESIQTEDQHIREMVARVAGTNDVKAGMTDPDAVPERVEPVTQGGDLWVLGEHRVLCGDSTRAADVARVLAGAKPFLMVTDPPYGVNYDPNWRQEAAEAGHLSYGARAVWRVANDDRADWSDAWALCPSDVVYTWSPGGDHVLETGRALVESGFGIRSMLIWRKSRFAISRGAYHYQHEPCWYAVRKGATAKWCGDRSQSTIWDIAHVKNETGHSTQKPVECMSRPMGNHEAREVYDPFLGSGTTLIAAEQLGRRCYGIELEPKYVDIAVRRWEQFTGKTAERVPA